MTVPSGTAAGALLVLALLLGAAAGRATLLLDGGATVADVPTTCGWDAAPELHAASPAADRATAVAVSTRRMPDMRPR